MSSSSVSLITSSVAGTTATSIISATSTISSVGPPSASPTGNSNSNGPSSPLLFFVALGFGVVFTNLWIIVGVKYCFRYNQRNRQRMNGEDPDGVDLGAMPRTHRRRREKKLMTMDEVNEKFPLTKYKTWRAGRAEEGLPTAGGINTASRPASIHKVPRESKEGEEDTTTKESAQAQTAPSAAEDSAGNGGHGQPKATGEKNESSAGADTPDDRRPKSTDSTIPPESPIKKVTTNEDDEDDEQIQHAVPAEQLPDPGDACAICIDTIEDDDDVRGLHCGHAFHASCVDPWLTSRRACCPLCKADYYVPKPRPDGVDEHGRVGGTLPAAPPTAFSIIGGGRGIRGRGRPAMIIPGRFMSIVYHDRDRNGFPIVVRADRHGRPFPTRPGDGGVPDSGAQPTERSTWRSRLAALRSGRNPQPANSPSNSADGTVAPTTPSQLEAGRSS